jgi:hypothetical protein
MPNNTQTSSGHVLNPLSAEGMVTLWLAMIGRCRGGLPTRWLRCVTVLLILVASGTGCGKRPSSYKDRIGTVDPATIPIDSPPPPGKTK